MHLDKNYLALGAGVWPGMVGAGVCCSPQELMLDLLIEFLTFVLKLSIGKKLRCKGCKSHSALHERLFKTQLKDCDCNSRINIVLVRVLLRNRSYRMNLYI